MVPDPMLLRFLSEYQQELAVQAFQQDDMYMVQQASIVVASESENARGIAGVGTAGGFPVTKDAAGDISTDDAEAGQAVEFDWNNAQRLVEPMPVIIGAAGEATFNNPSWATNAYAGAVARIVAGPGIGQARMILSNTADTLFFAQDFETAPTTQSMMEVVIVDPGLDETVFAVALSGKPTAERRGYLVRIDAQGQPYIDLSKPIIARYGKGIPLPPHLGIVGAEISAPQNPAPGTFRKDNYFPASTELQIIGYSYRNRAPFPSAYIMGNELYLAGEAENWTSGLTIDLRYVPIPPAFAAMRDYVFLPGADRALREAGALYCADRLMALGQQIDLKGFIDKKGKAESVFLAGVASRDSGYTFVTRDVMPY